MWVEIVLSGGAAKDRQYRMVWFTKEHLLGKERSVELSWKIRWLLVRLYSCYVDENYAFGRKKKNAPELMYEMYVIQLFSRHIRQKSSLVVNPRVALDSYSGEILEKMVLSWVVNYETRSILMLTSYIHCHRFVGALSTTVEFICHWNNSSEWKNWTVGKPIPSRLFCRLWRDKFGECYMNSTD